MYKNRDLFTSDVSNSGYITYIIVKDDKQNCGIGTELLNFSVDHFKHKDYKEISLVVRSKNGKALSFFTKNGFNEIKRKSDQFTDYGQKVIMVKAI